MNRITKAIREVGEEGGFIYVFDKNSFYYHSNKSVDLTDKVKAKLNN